MDFHSLKEWFTIENMMNLIEQYRSFGPLPGILLIIIEAFLPFLPLFLIVLANANAFGLWLGFLISWAGASAGAILVFLVIRRFGKSRILSFLHRNRQVEKITRWVEQHGFGPIFLLLCFPFTPSAVVNIVAGLSKINTFQYILAVVTGKMVMIFIISFVGHDVVSLIYKPVKTASVLLIIVILWFIGKRIEVRLAKRLEKEKKLGKSQ
ncbi:TVP38/TMEM64 family protein [Heyndrickxia sporothermodurans]|uniref:TVP38/TMEM64 family membrane protein n=1 Tax=Heyndrickxia sporothermodurans TaxID=46224 RepID=A0AB37H6T1_9BACI|nr:TVP38/TMEM64 family protein [Heyndrickxia sporothermodurans]MBL5767845.1 TVP38/TMEM64 family protein [Heyndrickxia sporothermodurans]MBL5771428.1 TVP38/TMEM64 family protein [Heyndrickxia sporothermodurans]MBL5775104.1 TVP38/TMEM64 family protein [Heyndrickxia sporothermodurans]MBL5778532.1 TVP38/TMEM64 family protein [Heyndrickxia sporothermodurans]MBL5782147.1 TVP38/TMEM64 family protein [Heyndrickxia sporothermodurans]